MYVIHDLYLEHENYSAQIDYFIVTRKCIFISECKNLFGTIEVNNKGEFTRTVYGSKRYHKEGIYSPITQNERHLDCVHAIRKSRTGVALFDALDPEFVKQLYVPVVVIANDKTVLNDKYAKKEVRDKIIKCDQLISFIKEANSKANKVETESDNWMRKIAERWLARNKENPTDYTKKYYEMEEQLKAEKGNDASESDSETVINQPGNGSEILCPKCGAPMVKRIAKKGTNAGKEFYGCSNYPTCRGIVNIMQ